MAESRNRTVSMTPGMSGAGDAVVQALKVPPHSVEAEQSVLGGLLLDNTAWDRLGGILSENDFYRAEHALIYRVVQRLISDNRPADVITVYESIKTEPDAFMTEGRSVQTLLDEAESRILQIGEEGNRKADYLEIEPLLKQVVARIDELYNREGGSDITGIATGFIDLDKQTSGLQKGDLVIVAGRPSMGKTAMALNIAENVALNEGLPVVVFSMEMSGAQLATRLLGSVGRVDQSRMRTGKLSDDEWPRVTDAIARLSNTQILIDETGSLTCLELRARARRIARNYGGTLGMVVVDYLQLMSGSTGGSSENRATEISEISRSLKSLAKELQCPVVALSQLNRGLEQRPNKRPVMSDLRESGAIEQDADLILFIYRDEVYHPDTTTDKGVAEVIIGKQRNGPIGTVRLSWQGQFTKFDNLAANTGTSYGGGFTPF